METAKNFLTMRTSVKLWKLLTFLTLVLCLTACKEEEDSNTGNETPPVVPVSNDDWQAVPAAGGTIEKGDITLTFPSGTFENDTVVAITEVKKGSMGGDYEVSPFYQLTLPDSSSKPFTVKIKADNTDGEADFLVFATSYSVSLKSENTSGIIIESSYSNGEYTATIPAFNRDDSKDKVSFTVGLCQREESETAGARKITRANDVLIGKMGNVKWDLSIAYWGTKYSLDYRKLTEKLPSINTLIAQSIKTINDLGFTIPDGYTIHYYIKSNLQMRWLGLLPENYGSFNANIFSIKSFDHIDIHDQLADDLDKLKLTLLHETLHYYQSHMLPSWFAKPRGEHNVMYEMGAVWIEKYGNGGELSANYQKETGLFMTFKNHYRNGLSRYRSDNLAMFSQDDEVGYGMAPLLHYMISKNYSRGYKDNVIVSLYKDYWPKMGKWLNAASFMEVLDDWYSDTFKEDFFIGVENMNKYHLALWKGEVMHDFNFNTVGSPDDSEKFNASNRLLSLNGKVYPMGSEGLFFVTEKNFLENSEMGNKKIVIKQEADRLKTYLLYLKDGKVMQYPKATEKGDSIAITVKDMSAMMGKLLKQNLFFLLTLRTDGTRYDEGFIPSKTSVELQDEEKNEKPRVEPTTLKFPAEGGTQNVKTILGHYNRAGYSISEDGKGWVSVSFTSASHGMDVTVTENKTGKPRSCIVNCHMTSSKSDNPSPSEYETFPISVTQEAGELEPGTIIMDAVNKCELTASAQMKHRKKGTTSQEQYKQTFDKNISFTQDGSTVHVQAAFSYKEGEYDNYQGVLSFDILNFEGDFTTSRLENVIYQYVYSNNYVDWTQPGVYGKGDEVKIEVSNVDWQKAVSSYVDGGSSHFVFSGSVNSGVHFKTLTERRVNLTDEETTENFDYVDNKNNEFKLIIDFKANGTSASRIAAPWQSDAVKNIIWQ